MTGEIAGDLGGAGYNVAIFRIASLGMLAKSLFYLVGVAGFEPTTP